MNELPPHLRRLLGAVEEEDISMNAAGAGGAHFAAKNIDTDGVLTKGEVTEDTSLGGANELDDAERKDAFVERIEGKGDLEEGTSAARASDRFQGGAAAAGGVGGTQKVAEGAIEALPAGTLVGRNAHDGALRAAQHAHHRHELPAAKDSTGSAHLVGGIIWVLVVLHVLAVVVWMRAWWRQRRSKDPTMRALAPGPPQKVTCSYDMDKAFSIPKIELPLKGLSLKLGPKA